MHKSRPISKNKKISNNITKNIPQKALQLLTTNNIKKQIFNKFNIKTKIKVKIKI